MSPDSLKIKPVEPWVKPLSPPDSIISPGPTPQTHREATNAKEHRNRNRTYVPHGRVSMDRRQRLVTMARHSTGNHLHNHNRLRNPRIQARALMFDIFQEDRIEREFKDFHAEHPEVYIGLVRLARTWQLNGSAKLGIATLFEVLRWNSHLNTDKDGGYKLNNNYRALYARLIMKQEPDLQGLFELRERTAELHRVA